MMLRDADRAAWRAIGTTVGGSSQEQQPNRETLRWLFPTETTAVLAMAAGQPHARHCRSHEGARLAVETTLLVLQDYITGQDSGLTTLRSGGLADDLAAQIVQRWRQAIAEVLLNAPLTTEELLRLEQQEGPAARQEIESQPLLAYDSTLLAVLVTPTALLTLRSGGGELLMVADNGQVANLFPTNVLYTPVEGFSLCVADAAQPIQSTVHVLDELPPALLLLATRGYPRTFHNEAAFMLIGTNLLTLLRTDGLERGQSSIEKWLTEAAQEGQGEDMTFAVLCRMAALQPSTLVRPSAATVELPIPLPAPLQDGIPPGDTGDPTGVFLERAPLSPIAEPRTNETEGRRERHLSPGYRLRSSPALVVTSQCRRTKRFFQLRIEGKGYGRWVAIQASAAEEGQSRISAENLHAFSGELSADSLYSGCPYCQAERVAQCSCGQVACWDGSRRAITCPWCAVIGEGSSHIEELQAREEHL